MSETVKFGYIAKQHLSGVVVVYPEQKKKKSLEPSTKEYRVQGSLYSQQKRAIADAVEYMRLYSKYKARIFVLTTPGFLEISKEVSVLSKFINNMRNNYSMGHYVWVRELTQNGYPHYHFVADVPQFDVLRLSALWSSYFGSQAVNSIRLGTKPNSKGKRHYWIISGKMANYLGKYIGKGLSSAEKGVRVRRFAISMELSKLSQPIKYRQEVHRTAIGTHFLQFELIEDPPDWIEMKGFFCKKRYKWRSVGDHSVYFGTEKN